MGKFDGALSELDGQILALKAQLADHEAARRLLLALANSDGSSAVSRFPTSAEFRGLGWTEAARRVLAERSPLQARDITTEVIRRGLVTRARNKSGTLSSALKQRPDLFAFDRVTQAWSLISTMVTE